MSIEQQIKNEAKGIKNDTSTLIIEQKFNSLFYLPPKPKEELEFMKKLLFNNRGDRYGLHASSIIASEKDFCVREQVLSLFYQQIQNQHIPLNLKRIFDEGNAIHEKWQRLFLRGDLCDVNGLDESQYNEEYDLSFTPDAIIKIGKKQYIVEIKSVNTFQFKKLNSHPGAKKQIQFYMLLTGIKNGIILCEDKNTQEIKMFVETFDEDEVVLFEERLENIKMRKDEFIKRKKMVKKICKEPNSKRASKCPMRDACFNIGLGRVKL